LHVNFRRLSFAMLLAWLGILLSACGSVIHTATPTFIPSPSSTTTVTLTPTITPTPTPPAPVAVLLAGPEADQSLARSLQTGLNDTVTATGARWQLRQQLTTQDLVPELRLVVAIPPDPGLAQLIAAAPGTQFLAIGIPGLEAAPNLTTIGAAGDRPDQQGFIAGVIAAMLSDDWRVGVISQSDTIDGRAARTGFLNGVTYFCGLCRPAHPPFYEYPLYIELPSTATPVEWQEAANYMVDHEALTVYVHSGTGDEVIFPILAQGGIQIISSGVPPQAASENWVVSLTNDPFSIVQDEVAGLLSGNTGGGSSLLVPIQFTNINPSLFSPGKQNLAEQILTDLQGGFIDTSVDLTTGENRP
jgi:basic membrane lipoprotein Med (substrate-binding protein (PBP1-ABC) superfamily)